MVDIRVAYDKLAGFETADEIAEFLQGEGVKAIPVRAGDCAISKWLQEQTGNCVYTTREQLGLGEIGTGVIVDPIRTTPAISEFVRRFDRGMYPELILEGCGFQDW